MEILATVAISKRMRPGRAPLVVVARSPGEIVNRADGNSARRLLGSAKHIDNGARLARGDRTAKAIHLLLDELKAQGLSQ